MDCTPQGHGELHGMGDNALKPQCRRHPMYVHSARFPHTMDFYQRLILFVIDAKFWHPGLLTSVAETCLMHSPNNVSCYLHWFVMWATYHDALSR